MRIVLGAFLSVLILAAGAYAVGYEDIRMVTPPEVMEKIEAGERVVILDVRSRGAYDSSDVRIKGDMRIAPDELAERAWELPMGAEIVTYCT